MRRGDRSRSAKLAFSVAVMTQLMLVIREFLLPAQLVAFLPVITGALRQLGHFSQLGFLASLVVWVVLGLVGNASRACRSQPGFKVGAIAAKLGTAGFFAASVWTHLSLKSSLILSAPILVIPAMLCVLPWKALLTLVPFTIFPLPNLVISTLLSFYATWNLHDVSWGTKGLRLSSVHRSAAARLRRLRDRTVLVWLVANAVLSAAAIHWQGRPVMPLNPIVEVWLIADAVIAGLALGYLLQRQLRR
jgi:chitin synthase